MDKESPSKEVSGWVLASVLDPVMCIPLVHGHPLWEVDFSGGNMDLIYT